MLNNKGRIPCGRDVSPRRVAFEGARASTRAVAAYFLNLALIRNSPTEDISIRYREIDSCHV